MRTLASALVLISAAASPGKADAWVVVRDSRSVTMSGETGDLEAARRHLRELGPGYLWFRRGGKQYVVRDGAVLKQIDEAAGPQEELGAAQGELGRRQGDLGRQQGEIGRLQGELGRKQAVVALRRAEREVDGERPSAEDREAERDVEETQRQLGKAQEVLGREQTNLGRAGAEQAGPPADGALPGAGEEGRPDHRVGAAQRDRQAGGVSLSGRSAFPAPRSAP